MTSYFGRAWKLTVTPQDGGETLTLGSSSWDQESLRVTFEIEQHAIVAYWHADISVWNCQPAMEQVIKKGDMVTLTAGYDMPGQGVIFSGKVFQPLWERCSDVDYRLQLHCLVGLYEDEIGKVNCTVPANTTAYDAITLVAGQTTPATPIDYLDEALKAESTKLPRAESVTGRASLYFLHAAMNLHLDCWVGFNGLNIRSLVPKNDTPDVVYAPPLSTRGDQAHSGEGELETKYILIGAPAQTERGVQWRTLLDPGVQLGQLAKLDLVTFQRLAQEIGQYQKPFLDKDGLYIIAGMKHCGDTRGNDWYTEITAVNREFSQLFATSK